MYEGSNAAISPRLWSWNFPNEMTVAWASSSDGTGRRRRCSGRWRTSGPVGVEARGGSRWTGPERAGGWPESGVRPWPLIAWLRGRNVWLVSTRAVTGRDGFGRGGPLRRAASSVSNDVRPGPPAVPLASSVAIRVRLSYASLISAIRLVAD